jgi:cell division septum initiation protein DivIVA
MASSNLQTELRDLREQMNDLKDMISREASRSGRAMRNRASEALDEASRTASSVTGDDVRARASDLANGAARTAHAVADYAREGADTVAGVVRRHPAAATSAGLLTLGIVGGIVGYLLANSTPPARDSRWRWN